MSIDAPLRLHREAVRADWIDYNGHMNVAYYVLAFDHATDAFLDFVGLDAAYREATGGSVFTVEAHVVYRRELDEGAPMAFATQLLGFDAKRLHFIHHMYHGDEGYVAAACEFLHLHVDLNSRRAAPMAKDRQRRLAEVLEAHRGLGVPPEAGRAVSMQARRGR